MKRTKSDSGKKPPAFQHAPPPRRIVCPICGLPGDGTGNEDVNGVITPDPKKKITCEFFSRCRDLKFDNDRHESARLKSEHFIKFHGDFCPVCQEPQIVCRQKKVAKVMARAKKLGSQNGDDWYLEPNEIREAADLEKCKPPNQSDYTAVLPNWWRDLR